MWSLTRSPFSVPSWFDEEDWFGAGFGKNTGISVWEDKQHVYVEAELPGLSHDDIDVTFNKGVLWIRGEKKEEVEDKEKKYYQKSSRNFSYRVAVPGVVDESKEPQASYHNGIMKIAFDKAEGSKPKKITVKKG